MKSLLACSLVAVVAAGWLFAATPEPVPVGRFKSTPGLSILHEQVFLAGQPALAIASGQGSCHLGVYIYDSDGNCVGWDDHVPFAAQDDAAVQWVPARTGRHLVEVRNLGRVVNGYRLGLE